MCYVSFFKTLVCENISVQGGQKSEGILYLLGPISKTMYITDSRLFKLGLKDGGQ